MKIERSSHGGRIQNPVEVEHAHSDSLIALAEWGLPLGLLIIALLLWIGVRAIVALPQWRHQLDPHRPQPF